MKRTIKYLLIILTFFLLIIFGNKKVYAADLYNGRAYNIINKNSGKCLNVNYGTDANGTNVTQYTQDGSVEQIFAIDYSNGLSKIYAVCSESGFGRVLDVLRTGGSSSGSIQAGNNVDIWAENDYDAQCWQFIDRGNGYYSIHLNSNTNLVLTAVGLGNGSGAGTSSSSNGNVIVQNYTGSDSQLWTLEDSPVLLSWFLVDSSKHLDCGRNNIIR